MSFTVPSGTPEPPTPTFTPTVDPATHQITKLVWTFPNSFHFLPGSRIAFQYQATLTPGTSAGTVVENTFGASTNNPEALATLACHDGSSPDTDLGCKASAHVTAGSGSDIDAQKWVHGDDSRGFYNTRTARFVPIGDPSCPLLVADGKNYTRFPCVALVLAGQNFTFLLNLTNVGTTPATQSRLVDDLPQLDDKGVIVNGSRGTEWNPRPLMIGAPSIVTGQPGTLSSLAYSETAPGCTTDLNTPPTDCPPGAWTPTFDSSAESWRTFIDFDAPLAPGDSTQVTVTMSAPADLDTSSNDLPIAWNSFAHSDFFTNPDGSTTQLPAVEPIKVGVAMPFGNLQVEKRITGDIPPGSTIGAFQVSYSCIVTTAAGDQVTVASGSGSFDAGRPLTVRHVPAGAVCTVHETDTGGGIVTEPPPVTIEPDTNTEVPSPTITTVTNDFPAHPGSPPSDNAGSGGLAGTGIDIGAPLGAAALLIVLGGGAWLAGGQRRRRHT